MTFSILEEWVKQIAATKSTKRRVCTESFDDDNAITMPEETSSAASRPSKKHINNLGVAIVAHERALPLKNIYIRDQHQHQVKANQKRCVTKSLRPLRIAVAMVALKMKMTKKEWRAIEQSPAKREGVHISDHVHCRYICSCIP